MHEGVDEEIREGRKGVDEEPVEIVKRGDEITLTVPKPVHRNDTAFVRVQQEDSLPYSALIVIFRYHTSCPWS